MVLVVGLDRLDGSAIDGMSDELWSQHTAELLAQKPKDAPFNEHCARYADGTDLRTAAMQSFVESAPPLAVIWDSDGTVVASEQVIIMASNSLLTARGMPALGNDELKAGFHMPTATRLASIIPEERRGAGADLAAEFYTAATQLATSHAAPCNGVPQVLEELASRSIAQAVVSNSLSSFVIECLQAVGVLRFFEGHVDGEDTVPAHKPDPRGLLQSMHSLGVTAPCRCVYVGDSTGDMAAAKAAGMRSVGVTWGSRTRVELEQGGAGSVVENGEELLAACLATPSADS